MKDQRSIDTQSSGPPSPIADGFVLGGPSNPPDPAFNAYRRDLADTALAGTVIASHYAEPLPRHIRSEAKLMEAPSEAARMIASLSKGQGFDLLDSSRGWAWGYAADGRVGYVPASAIGA